MAKHFLTAMNKGFRAMLIEKPTLIKSTLFFTGLTRVSLLKKVLLVLSLFHWPDLHR